MVKNPYQGDSNTARAKKEGYPARSVYKLEEIDKRIGLLKMGMKVLDLGACPGSWSLYTANKIGVNGKLIAVDIEPLRVVLPPNSTFFRGDAFCLDQNLWPLGAAYDVVLSDMAPNTTGNRLGDQMASQELFMKALGLAATLLRRGGSFVGKLFMNEDFSIAKQAVKAHFAEQKVIKPKGTRSSSYEIFMIGINKK